MSDYEGGLPLGRMDAHDPDLAVDVSARDGVVYLTESSQGNPSFAQLTGVLSPAEAHELAGALKLAASAASRERAVDRALELISEGAVVG